MSNKKIRFMSRRDMTITPLVELALLVLSGASVKASMLLSGDLRVIEMALMGYGFLFAWTLLALKILRQFFPIKEGIYSLSKNPNQIFIWNLYGFLCVMNLSVAYTNNLLPIPLRKLFFKLLGSKIASGVVVMNGTITDPHLLTVEDNVVLGDECYISPHAIISMPGDDVLIIKKIHLKKDCIIGARAILSPGVVVEEGATVPPLALIPMNEHVKARPL